VNVTVDICRRSTDVKLSAATTSRYLPANVIDSTRRDVQQARDICSDVNVTSCSTCWRHYGDVIMSLITWRRVVNEPAYQLHDVWVLIDRYKQQMLSGELQRQYHC